MVKNPRILRRLQDDECRASPPDFERNLRLFEAMDKHARALGVGEQDRHTLPLKLRLARALSV